jgi:hypothetical protein
MEGLMPEAYAPFAQRVFASFANASAVTVASDVAEGIWRAANDDSGMLRFPAGPDAAALALSSAAGSPAEPSRRTHAAYTFGTE